MFNFQVSTVFVTLIARNCELQKLCPSVQVRFKNDSGAGYDESDIVVLLIFDERKTPD